MEEEAAAEHLMSRKGGLIQIKKKKIPKRPFFSFFFYTRFSHFIEFNTWPWK